MERRERLFVLTCFLFLDYLTDNDCLAVTLDQHGEIKTPLKQYNHIEIQAIQTNMKTVGILCSDAFSLHRLQLAWLPEKKARTAIPYALEDKLAEPVERLHFAFNKQFYRDGYYLITVCSRNYIEQLLIQLNSLKLKCDVLTLDWFALNDNEIGITKNGLLVNNSPFFQGKLPAEIAISYLNSKPATTPIYRFSDSSLELDSHASETFDESFYLWASRRLNQKNVLNLLQGEFQKKSTQTQLKRWYITAAAMTVLWLISLGIHNLISFNNLNNKLQAVNNDIATIYKEFFPNAKQIISPQFRIQQLLKSQKNTGDMTFWILLNHFSNAAKQTNTLVDQIRYQNQRLQITIINKDFKELEMLQTQLKQARINVKQNQASSKNNQVVSTLELSL